MSPYLKGSGALVSTKQFPDIQESVESCAACIGLKTVPNVYVLHMDGMFNAFALRFCINNMWFCYRTLWMLWTKNRMHCVSISAMKWRIYTVNTHYGKPFSLQPWFFRFGAAYSRSREYTCDAYGSACCELPESSRLGLAALAVGGTKYTVLNGETTWIS